MRDTGRTVRMVCRRPSKGTRGYDDVGCGKTTHLEFEGRSPYHGGDDVAWMCVKCRLVTHPQDGVYPDEQG